MLRSPTLGPNDGGGGTSVHVHDKYTHGKGALVTPDQGKCEEMHGIE